jgi:hypothetical protein
VLRVEHLERGGDGVPAADVMLVCFASYVTLQLMLVGIAGYVTLCQHLSTALIAWVGSTWSGMGPWNLTVD